LRLEDPEEEPVLGVVGRVVGAGVEGLLGFVVGLLGFVVGAGVLGFCVETPDEEEEEPELELEPDL